MKNYIQLVKQIIKDGDLQPNRTGVDAISLFGTQMRWDLLEGFPLLTTRRMFFRGIVEELLFFLRGETNTKLLEEKGVNIWKGNTTREFLDSRDLGYPEGEMGPGYGFQWRNAGGTYPLWRKEKIRDGIDQLQEAVILLREDPFSRRNLVCAWDAVSIDDMALPPCHVLFQFNVRSNEMIRANQLDCMFTMRSVDTILGLPFNIASYALLTHILAKITGILPGHLIFSGGNTHVYKTHLAGFKEQMYRTPFCLPRLKIKKELNSLEDAEKLCFEDIILENYQSHPGIQFDMVV